MREYESCFAHLIKNFVAYRTASERWNESSYGDNLRLFDHYCRVTYPDAVALTQEMVDNWCRQKETETNNSCRTRIYVVYNFTKYLVERGLSDICPPELPREERRTYIPYAFQDAEIEQFFHACDNLPNVKETYHALIRRITVPVFFRFLYSSGIRTTEARLLRLADTDLRHGILSIHHSKGHDQHYIVLHDSMTQLLQRYDAAIRKWYPERTYFFQSHGDRPYSSGWVKQNFRVIWDSISTNRYAVAYALRHHYATSNINRWTGEGFAFDDKLTYLSKSMGHTSLESTKYYYSIVPVLSQVLLNKTEQGFNELVPEVMYDGEE